MTRALTRDLAAILLTGLGLWLGSDSDGVSPRVLAFAAATLVAFGTTASWGLGLLTLGLGLTAHPLERFPLAWLPVSAGALLAGGALGLLGRYLAASRWHGDGAATPDRRRAPHPVRPDRMPSGPTTSQARLRGILLLSFVLLVIAEPTSLHLAEASGAPHLLSLTVSEPTTLTSVPVARHVALPATVVAGDPLEAPRAWLVVLALLAAWVSFAHLPLETPGSAPGGMTRPPQEALRGGFLRHLAAASHPNLTRAVGLLIAAEAGAALLLPLVAGGITLDPEALRVHLTLTSGPGGAVTAVSAPEAWLAPWSHGPWPALRLALGLGLLATLAARSGLAAPAPLAPTGSPGLRGPRLALIGLLGVLALGFLSEAMAAVAVLGWLSTLGGAVGPGGTRSCRAEEAEAARPGGAQPSPATGSRAQHLGLLGAFLLLTLALALAPLGVAASPLGP